MIIPAKQTNGIFIFQKSPSPGQLIIVQIHDIWDLPLINNATTNQSTPPSAFVSVKTLQETIERKRAKASTHVHEPSTVASFGETLKLEFSELSSPNQIHKIFISIADNITKRYIARFYVPISVMKFPSYRQISLVLRSVSPFPNIPSPHARISITNIDTTISSTFSLQKEYESKMIFLELYLKTAQIKVDFRVICVAMVIHDSNEYKSTLKQRHERFKSGLDSCLNPLEPHHVLDFENGGDLLDNEAMNHIVINGSIYNHSSKVDKGKYYQMTNAIGSTNGVFIWNQHLVLFDKMDLYTPESSLVLEFYREPIGNPKIQDSSFEFERPTSSRPIDEMIGYASVALGDFTILQSNQSGNIINLDNLQVVLFGKYDNSTIASCSIDVRVPDNWVTTTFNIAFNGPKETNRFNSNSKYKT